MLWVETTHVNGVFGFMTEGNHVKEYYNVFNGMLCKLLLPYHYVSLTHWDTNPSVASGFLCTKEDRVQKCADVFDGMLCEIL